MSHSLKAIPMLYFVCQLFCPFKEKIRQDLGNNKECVIIGNVFSF